MTRALSLRTRALLAVALLVGFYLLALALIAALVYLPWAEWTYLDRVEPRLVLFAALCTFAIVRAVMPRRDRFEAPGPRLTAATEPRLFAMIEDVARATGQEPPAEVYLTPEVNAWVTQRGGLAGVGTRRIMGIGLPLQALLTVGELRAVIAHEFGHYVSGDTRLGPWIYRTRVAIERTFVELSRHSRWVAAPFQWYGKGFLRVTHAISRAQEFVADATAARVAGRDELGRALRKLAGGDGAYGAYWRDELVPVLELGYRPPLAVGFRQFIAAPQIAPQVERIVEASLALEKSDPYDTHPTLSHRLAALDGHPTHAPRPDDDAPSLGLLADVDASELALIRSLVAAGKEAPTLTPLHWDDVPATALAIGWRCTVEPAVAGLAGLKPEQLPGFVTNLPQLAVRLELATSIGRLQPDHVEWAKGIVGAALSLALLERVREGVLALDAPPGQPVRFAAGGVELLPMSACQRLAQGTLTADDWRAQCEAAGIAGVDLGAVAAAATAKTASTTATSAA